MQINKAIQDKLIEAAEKAGQITLKYFRSSHVDVERKDDNSPVTIADQEAEDLILDHLRAIDPAITIVAEEMVAAGQIPDLTDVDVFWLVDPLDGTKEFIRGSGDYTVNIALIVNKEPVFGIVYAPALGEMFIGDVRAGKAWLRKSDGTMTEIKVRDVPQEGMTVVGSRHHANDKEMDAFLKGKLVKDFSSRGSSLKFCEVAAGRADIYPRFGPTCEWDIAAGDAVLRAAGGLVTDVDKGNQTMKYAKRKDFYNSHFIAWGKLRPK